mgnify:FL=1
MQIFRPETGTETVTIVKLRMGTKTRTKTQVTDRLVMETEIITIRLEEPIETETGMSTTESVSMVTEPETEMEELTIRMETTMVIEILDFNGVEMETGTLIMALDPRTETTTGT